MRKKKFGVDLTKIEGDGEFPCPKCETLISPDDETENVYTVVETIIGDDENLESIVIRCNKCKSIINLEGLIALSEEGDSRVEILEALPESEPDYKTSHIISLDGKSFCKIDVEYAQKEDVKAFKRFRKLRIGDPFKGIITTEKTEVGEVKREDLQEIIKAVKKRFKGLKGMDIYIVELKNGQKESIGKASDL